MKYGIAVRNMGPQSTAATLRACVSAAEALGYDAVFVSDHLCIPPDDTEGSGGRYLDVLATLAFLAGITTRIRLGISVLVLPYRPAVLTAKQVATIQELSAGRMILGVGVGWMKREFAALGVDKRMRARLSDETLRVLTRLFAQDVAEYHGELVDFPPFVFAPRPPLPPIWIGGNGGPALRRVMEFGAGWHPMLPADKLQPMVGELKERLRGAGRPDSIDIVVRRGLRLEDTAAARARLATEQAAGATYFILDLGRYPSEKEFIAQAETFMTKVASA
ncbi:MAG TPA: TIGR03619 family F420-dependent LLM class oxidoreductase [Candidatus Binataceae bacterium]|nr:TIGR03619 family F420-dependent LLM class oxidoreductase [Candidatus Binataceae bacterium]